MAIKSITSGYVRKEHVENALSYLLPIAQCKPNYIPYPDGLYIVGMGYDVQNIQTLYKLAVVDHIWHSRDNK